MFAAGRSWAWLLAFALAAACGGGGSECGNGVVEQGEQCDDGNTASGDGCTASCTSEQLTIVWTIVGNEVPGMQQNCSGVGASDIRLQLVGPSMVDETVDCAFSQYPVRGLLPGMYTITATLLDASTPPLAITTGTSYPYLYPGGNQQVTIDIPREDFPAAYDGWFFFRTIWNGSMTCTGAVPPVTEQIVKFERGGSTLVVTGEQGQVIDGVTPGACHPADPLLETSPQLVKDLPWGPLTVTITGRDASGTPQFMETFDAFVFAGIATPTFAFDVNSLAPDAGPMPPDAGPVDAGPVDAAPPDAL